MGSRNRLVKHTLDEVIDNRIGKRGTPHRDAFELELQLDLIGQHIKEIRKKRNLTQAQLGELIGVQKAQVSKLENNTSNFSIGTIMKVFKALDAEVKLKIILNDNNIEVG
jgi:DNA-binding XRE family transcriptional regulator